MHTAYKNTLEKLRTDKIKKNKKDQTYGEAEAQSISKMDLASCDPSTIVVSFDVENVFALPQNSVSSAFYKRKLDTFNLTAVEARSKQAYIVLWD